MEEYCDLVFPADRFQVSCLAPPPPPPPPPLVVKPEQCDDWALEVVEESPGDAFYSSNSHLQEFIPVGGDGHLDLYPAQGFGWPIPDQILFQCYSLPGLEADTPPPRFPKNEPPPPPPPLASFAGMDDPATSSSGSVAEDQCNEFDHQMLVSAASSMAEGHILCSLGGSAATPSSWFGDEEKDGYGKNEDLEAALGIGTGCLEPPKTLLKTGEDRDRDENSDDEVEEIEPERTPTRNRQQKKRPYSSCSSIDPQSVAARRRRRRISERVRCLEKLIPGGSKMDTASMLEEAIHYVKFLQLQVALLEAIGDGGDAGGDHHKPPPTPPLVLSEELQEVLFRNRCCVAPIKQ